MSTKDYHSSRKEVVNFLLSRINYEQAISVSYTQREFRLDRMRDFLGRLNNPQDRLRIIHVAGTKGKGSTSAMIAAALSAAGYRTGLYTSPHVDRLEERLVIDGQTCPEEAFGELVAKVRPIVEQMDIQGRQQNAPEPGPTYFEILTAMALLYFVAAETDFAVMEVGLGGRLDSTNVCQPLVSVITSISLDHTQQLGNTLAKIAGEKAGIIKPGVPVISGVLEEEPRNVIAAIAQQHRCRLMQLGVDFTSRYHAPIGIDSTDSATHGRIDFQSRRSSSQWNISGVEVGLLGSHQARNAAVALAVLEELSDQGWQLPEIAVRQGLANLRFPARVEIVTRQPTVVVDTAHNVASIQSLIKTLEESFVSSRRILVFAATQDKDVRGMLRILLPHFETVILTRYLNNPRAMNLQDLEELAGERSPISRFSCTDPKAAWQQVRELATADHLVCVTGSFFLAAEMRPEIAQNPLKLAEKSVTR
jgi:dihydrofolate synthase / folylpolyglutamate synthase